MSQLYWHCLKKIFYSNFTHYIFRGKINLAFCLFDSSDILSELQLIISEHVRKGENYKEKERTIETNRENIEADKPFQNKHH